MSRSESTDGAEQKPKKSLRQSFGRTVMKVGFIRNWQIRRTIKYIDKMKEKGRRLPPELAEFDRRVLSRVPKNQRAKMIEEAMAANESGIAETNRAYRRAANNQGRQSGRGGGRTRPGLPPGALQQARQQQTKQGQGKQGQGRRRGS